MEAVLASPQYIQDTRLGRLRDLVINAPQEVCVERARYLTRAMKEHWDKHPLTRMSLALEHILNNISVIIREDELIVGCRTSKIKGAPLFPENKIRWIEGDVDNFSNRVLQCAQILKEEQQELKQDIIPFWKGKSVEEYFETLLPPDVADDMDKYIFTMMLEITYGIGHFTMNYDRILSKGLWGIIAETEEKFEALNDSEKTSEKGLFYEAVIRSLKGAVSFAGRYADHALKLAGNENDPDRRAELKQIASICKRVPGNPAQTFHEAVQSLYFIHLISQIESGGNSISLGRIDQILYPYYKKDIDAGEITPDKARELIALLFLKTNEIWNVLEEAFIPGGEGPEGKTTQNVVVGGIDSDGNDATNELSFLGLDAYADIRTVQPNFGVRLSSKSPEEFFQRSVDYARDGVLIHFFYDDSIVDSLTQAGHTLTDARNYGVCGCLEPNAQGKSFGSTFAVQFSGIKCVEFVLSNGIDNTFGYQSGIQTGDPAQFQSYDDAWNAYKTQFSHFIGQMVRGMHCLDKAVAEMVPSPFASAMIDGPLDKGKDLTKGGAIYNSTGVQFIGFSNVADSLYAVKKAIFDEGRFTIEDLAIWLSDDWMDSEDKQAYFRNRLAKYGNDIDEVDSIATDVLNHFCDELSQHKNYRGGEFWPGVFSVGFHLAFGAFTAATPDGRSSGEILGNGITPSEGFATNGPTAIMNSVTKLPLKRVYNGLNLNMRFSGKQIKVENLHALVKSYFESGGIQVQFNMIDSDILKDAQDQPDNHRDLLVRISGYSATFINLTEGAQDEIIKRTQYDL